MKKRLVISFLIIFILIGYSASCSSTPSQTLDSSSTDEKTMEVTVEPEPTIIPTVEPIATSGIDVFQEGNQLCTPDSRDGSFIVVCEDKKIKIAQSESRGRYIIQLLREIPIQLTSPFQIELDLTSTKSDVVEIDQNQYALFLRNAAGEPYLVQFAGTYFGLASLDFGDELRIQPIYNLTFSNNLNLSGISNSILLRCGDQHCDLQFNDVFSGRFPIDLSGGISEVGYFTSSNWDQSFGEVTISDFYLKEVILSESEQQAFQVQDPLTESLGIFSTSALSGAFQDYDEEGFHFSPLIPFGYYTALINQSLADMIISADVILDIDPQGSSSQYAGLVCRSSSEGKYMAIIRADGTYSIYRDTPKYPFSLLAERRSDAILPGREENHLELACIGDQILFSINGQLVESLTDSRFGLRFGRAGFFTKAGNEPSADAIIFNDLIITEAQ